MGTMQRTLILMLSLVGVLAGADDGEAQRRAAMREELDLIAEQVRLNRAFTLIHELVRPSVVSIHISQTRWQFDHLRDVDVGEGSGFVIHADDEASYILTNAHVVLQMNQAREFIRGRHNAPVWYERIRITTHRGESLPAIPVGADIDTDLALLKVAHPGMTAITWGNSDAVQVGDYVVALGYPLRVGYSATFGNISATDRSTRWFRREGGYEAFLQTDAAINPGNSGGPLVDLRGEVVGLNASMVSRGGGNIGIGFAIPARLAQRVADDLLRHGRVHRPMIGIQMDEVSSREAREEGLPTAVAAGVRVSLVLPGSPAEAGGLRDGDIIVAVDEIEIIGIQQFRVRIATVAAGASCRLRVWRDGAAHELEVSPVPQEELTRRLQERAQLRAETVVNWPHYGLTLGRDQHRGAIITAVAQGSHAARAGLQVGDRILRIYDYGPVESLAEIAELDRRPELVLLVYHRGHPWLVRMRR